MSPVPPEQEHVGQSRQERGALADGGQGSARLTFAAAQVLFRRSDFI